MKIGGVADNSLTVTKSLDNKIKVAGILFYETCVLMSWLTMQIFYVVDIIMQLLENFALTTQHWC